MNRNQRRDLLVLLNNHHRSQQAIDHEVEWLHELLYHVCLLYTSDAADE